MKTRLLAHCLAFVTAAGTVQGVATAAVAQTTVDAPRFTKSSDYSAAKNWSLKAETIAPHGRNPFFFPLSPGHKHILERPDHPEGHFRKETAVLEQTEPFDLPDIGKFETAVVQEEEYVDEELVQRAHLWLAIDRSTGSVHAFGKVIWEVEDGKPIITGSWRAGDPPGNSAAEPGLAMPGIIAVGARYVVNGGEDGPESGAEALETGVEIAVPAGTFKNCVRIREQGLVGQMEVVVRVWCPQVGLVADSDSGQLIASNALPSSHPGADVSSFGRYLANVPPPPEPKLTAEQATETALKRMPGRMTSVVIERKRGRYVYVVEIMTSDTGERDVLVDIQSGEIVGIE